MMNVIDLFSGVGGFSNGFRKAGFRIVLAMKLMQILLRVIKRIIMKQL